MKPTVEAKNICFNYHSLDGETEAIKDLSFTVEKGEFISIVGPSGCGNALPAKIQMHRKSGALILTMSKINLLSGKVRKTKSFPSGIRRRNSLPSRRTESFKDF